MRNLNNYTSQTRWNDMKKYLTKRELSLSEKHFEEIAKSKSTKQAFFELKLIFDFKLNYSKFCKLKRKILRGYTYSQYCENHTVSLPFKREKYYQIEKDIFTGLQNIVLEGKQIKLPLGMDLIRLFKVNRNFKKLVVNWKASNDRKKYLLQNNIPIAKCEGYDAWGNPIFTEGEKWIIYYTDDYYPMFQTYRIKKIKQLSDGRKVKMKVNNNIKDYDFNLSALTRKRMRKLVADGSINVSKLELLDFNKPKNGI